METKSRMRVRLTSLRVSVGILAFLLLAISGLSSLVLAKNVHAMSECGVLFLCPTPTPTPQPLPLPSPTLTPHPTPTTSPTPIPRPTPSPTPILYSTPSPTPYPTPRSTPQPVSSPTAPTNVLPTATSTITSVGGTQTHDPNTTNIPGIKGGNPGNQMPNQAGGSGFSSMIVIAAVIFLCLLVSLGMGLFILRHLLLPPIHIKLPPSGVSSWSRSRVLNPNNSKSAGMNEHA